MEKNVKSKYKKLIDISFRLVKRTIRTFSGKFSKKTYTQHQHAVAIMLMKYEDKPYRDIAELIKVMCEYFGFKGSVPHFTTLQKFFERIPTYIWDFLITKSYQQFKSDIANIGIDTTGYKLRHSSYYYEQRINKKVKKKRFMKHIISVDTDNQGIIASYDRRSHINDTETFRPVARKTRKIVKIGNATADKGFDSEKNHECINDELGGYAIIPPRNEGTPVWKTTGYYRKKMRRDFPKKLYDQRPKVETVNSVEKRKFGDELRSKLLKMQRREMKVIDVVYNIHRYINYFVSEFIGFLQSRGKEKLINEVNYSY
jgi:hypothetical protein